MTGKIFKVRNPNVPDCRFEWHPGKRIVYRVTLDGERETGEPIAMDIENEGAAINAVLIWSRGYAVGSERTINGVIR